MHAAEIKFLNGFPDFILLSDVRSLVQCATGLMVRCSVVGTVCHRLNGRCSN